MPFRLLFPCLCGCLLLAQVPPIKPIKPREIPRVQPEPIFLHVEYPQHSQHFKIEGKKIILTVRFNAPVDPASVIPGQTVRVAFPKNQNAAGTLVWVNPREFTWTAGANMHDICKFTPDCSFKLTLSDTIKTKGGTRLDGDKNGQAGGDYTMIYTIIG